MSAHIIKEQSPADGRVLLVSAHNGSGNCVVISLTSVEVEIGAHVVILHWRLLSSIGWVDLSKLLQSFIHSVLEKQVVDEIETVVGLDGEGLLGQHIDEGAIEGGELMVEDASSLLPISE